MIGHRLGIRKFNASQDLFVLDWVLESEKPTRGSRLFGIQQRGASMNTLQQGHDSKPPNILPALS